ncbi:solute carrier family 22 member 1-like [Plodia interpunctella]|uniref:solute carrier family 22 member 1-like n=1 Tax=Plodia interpunctella TaxID=58824 RepID=UPI0023683256|nr:solute carrier family 22 member 1-like [Plodia interpunctella]
MKKQNAPSRTNPIEKYFSVIRLYHYFFFFVIFLSQVPVFWHFLSLIFLSPHMNFYCTKTHLVIRNASLVNYCPCDEVKWDRSVFTETVQTKFDLYCETQWLISFTQSILYLGTLLGSIFFGILSDKLGRRCACTISIFLLAVSGCLSSIMPNVTAYIFMRCLEGFSAGGYIVASFVFVIEHCGPNNREVISALFHLPLNVGHISLAGVSYFLRDCSYFQLALSVPVFFFVSIRYLTMESPKWLMDQGHLEEAAIIMEKISTFNRKPHGSFKAEIVEYDAGRSNSSRKKMHFIEVFKHRRLFINISCMSAIYFLCGLGFFGVSQYIGQMSGDMHKNVAISGILLVPATISAIFLLILLRRRILLMITTFLSGFFMIIVIFIPDELSLLRVICACVCDCFFFMSFITAFLFGVELFPTAVRSSALGFLSLMSRFGQIVAPPLNSLPEFVTGLVFGVLAICGSVLCYPLPETKNIDLPSTLQDAKDTKKTRAEKQDKGKSTENEEADTSKRTE